MTTHEPPGPPGPPDEASPGTQPGARRADSRVIRRPPTRRNTGRRKKRQPGFWRGHRLRAASLVLGIVMVLLGGSAYAWYSYLNGKLENIDRVHVDGLTNPGQKEGETTAPPESGQPLNVLLLGADAGGSETSVAEELADDQWSSGAHRSDTMMIVHIPADRRSAQLISLPRDSWVKVPGYGHQKINAAFSYGGPSLAVRTVSGLTDMPINHFAIIDWNGFKQMTEDVGGVKVRIPETVVDPCQPEDSSQPLESCPGGWPTEEFMDPAEAADYNAKVWTAGWHTIQGEDALKYVRQRHGLPGGDFSRINRQQNFLRALMGKMMDRVSGGNVVDTTRLVGTISDYLTVDDGWSSDEIKSLALSMRKLQEEDVTFMTVPMKGYGRSDDGQSYIDIDNRQVKELVSAIQTDTVDAYLRKHPDSELKSSDQIE